MSDSWESWYNFEQPSIYFKGAVQEGSQWVVFLLSQKNLAASECCIGAAEVSQAKREDAVQRSGNG